jgi:hypothetical protein
MSPLGRPGARLAFSALLWIGVIPTLCCVDWQVGSTSSSYLAVQSPIRVANASTELGDWPSPQVLLERALEQYRQDVTAYRCLFTRQERIGDKLTSQQTIDVTLRDSPRALALRWVRNGDRVHRLVYEQGRNRGESGEEYALVEPAGTVARFCASRVPIAIHGDLARKSSRYTLDQFGFRATLERALKVNAVAAERGELDLRYAGTGRVSGRPTIVLERRLPYPGRGGVYPDALLVLHLDQEWLLPVAVFSYADGEGLMLLGSYVATDVELNPPLDEHNFAL